MAIRRQVRHGPIVMLMTGIVLLLFGTVSLGSASPKPPLALTGVVISKQTFNPSSNEHIEVTYTLSRDAVVRLRIYDVDRRLVRTLAMGVKRRGGRNHVTWNGRDDVGRIVPNEAYFFTIEATDADGNTAVYDPVTFSGGEFGDIRVGELDRASGTVTYQLSQPSRVLLRAGITGSAMLKTIVDWEPRAAGTVTEYWNGKDENNLIDVLGRKHTMILSYMTLPENSVITYGNSKYDYRTYRATLAPNRPLKPDRPMANCRRLSPHFSESRLTDRSFPVSVSFPERAAADVPKSAGRVIVRLDVDPKDRPVLEGRQFEVILFVDTVFHLEEERGYLPLNAPIELGPLPPGEHVITANVITFTDQIGVGSRKLILTP
jgi:hypothetical protein